MKQYLFSLFSRSTRGLAAVVAGLAVGPCAVAHAALLSSGACDTSTLTQPFLRWGDSNYYKLVPGANFEGSLTGWTLSGGAKVVAGSEPYGVTGKIGSWSLSVPAGGVAQSPFTCVTAAYPTLRFFARNGGILSSVLVQVVYIDPILGQVRIPVGTVALSGSWQPTLPMLTASAVPGTLNGGTAYVALRFTGVTGTSLLDDAFIDPRMGY
jgi:hypothetical protein